RDHHVEVGDPSLERLLLAAPILLRQLARVSALRLLHRHAEVEEGRAEALHLLAHRGPHVEARHDRTEPPRCRDGLEPSDAGTQPSRRASASSAEGFCTFTTASASNAFSTRLAPASAKASSGKDAASPAPRSTATSKPAPASRPTASGTSATRRSPGTFSFGTPSRISAHGIRARGPAAVEPTGLAPAGSTGRSDERAGKA